MPLISLLLNRLHESPETPLPALAREFGVSEAWLAFIINSDGFKFQLSEKQNAHLESLPR